MPNNFVRNNEHGVHIVGKMAGRGRGRGRGLLSGSPVVPGARGNEEERVSIAMCK